MNTDADKLGFELVATSSGTSTAETQCAEKRLLEKAEEVALGYKGIEVFVCNLKQDPDGHLIGQLANFSNVCATQYEGLRLGQMISFRHPHVQHISKTLEKPDTGIGTVKP